MKIQSLIFLLAVSISLADSEKTILGGSEKVLSLRDKMPQEVSAMVGHKPFLSYTDKEDGRPIMRWSFFPKECKKCGEWISLHPNDKKNNLIWIEKEDCEHRNIVRGNKTYYSLVVEFYVVGGSWFVYNAEYFYREN